MIQITLKYLTYIVFVVLATCCYAQQTSPFMGQRTITEAPIEGAAVEVWVSVVLDRILGVDEKNYRHSQVIYISLTWEDPRFYSIVGATPRDDCSLTCVTGGSACCDHPWLPGVDLLNVFDLPEGRIVRHGLYANAVNPVVTWWNLVQGEFFSTMDFRAFPFDRQSLKIECMAQTGWNLTFIPSQSGRLKDKVLGDDVSGWTFSDIGIQAWEGEDAGVTNDLDTSMPGSLTDPRYKYNNTVIDSFGILTTGFNVYINLDRNFNFYIFSVLVPIVLTAMMCMAVFWMDPHSIAERVGVVITLFLALTALQFVINDKLPDSSYFTGVTILIVVSNIILFITLMESMVVYSLTKGYLGEALREMEEDEHDRVQKELDDAELIENADLVGSSIDAPTSAPLESNGPSPPSYADGSRDAMRRVSYSTPGYPIRDATGSYPTINPYGSSSGSAAPYPPPASRGNSGTHPNPNTNPNTNIDIGIPSSTSASLKASQTVAGMGTSSVHVFTPYPAGEMEESYPTAGVRSASVDSNLSSAHIVGNSVSTDECSMANGCTTTGDTERQSGRHSDGSRVGPTNSGKNRNKTGNGRPKNGGRKGEVDNSTDVNEVANQAMSIDGSHADGINSAGSVHDRSGDKGGMSFADKYLRVDVLKRTLRSRHRKPASDNEKEISSTTNSDDKAKRGKRERTMNYRFLHNYVEKRPYQAYRLAKRIDKVAMALLLIGYPIFAVAVFVLKKDSELT